MLNNLVFYNHFGNGDLFESREFIKEIMTIIPSENYSYAHGKNKRMFSDIPNLNYQPITDFMLADKSFVHGQSGDLYINTWIGHNSKYVLSQVGCTIDNNYQMFNDVLKSLNFPLLSRPFIEYLPVVGYGSYNVKDVDKFVDKDKRKKILVCNGIVNSMQAENFDMNSPIKLLAAEHPDILFITTQGIETSIKNIISTSDIIKVTDGFDLNDISYLAKFVDVIIGRKSGPFVFAHTRDVWYSDKKSLSFTYAEHSSHFVQGNDLPLRKYWSPATDINQVIRKVEEVIND